MNACHALFPLESPLPGFCYLWNALLIWPHGLSDMLIAVAWIPVYWLSGGVKVITVFVSFPTAILLARVVPQILETPTAQEMRLARDELELQARILREQAALLDLSQDAILVQSIDEKSLLWNQGAERMYGWTKAEAIGVNANSLLETRFLEPFAEIKERLEKTGYWEGELQKKRRDGQTLIVSSRWALGRDSDGRPEKILVIDTDITEQRRAEDRLQELSGRLLRLQDDQRRKIAGDLHDTTGQDLVALSSILGHLHASIPSNSRRARKAITQCQGLADRCIREIRTLSYVLHPHMLDEAGLEDAIRHYVRGFSERTGIEVKFEVSPNFGRLPQDEEIALFRVMQESLVNIQRHSGSFSADILLSRTAEGVLLQTSDHGHGIQGNGKGYTKGASFAGGVGIQSMRERMKQVRGQLDIESSPNGTTVRAIVGKHAKE